MRYAGKIFTGCIIMIAFLVPSGFYEAIIPVFIIAGMCWFFLKDYKNLKQTVLQPHVLWAVLLYLYVLSGIFFSANFKGALSSLSTKLPFLLFPFILGSASMISANLIERAVNGFVISITACLLLALGYALVDIGLTGEHLVQINESIYNKINYYGLTRLFFNWHPTYVALYANMAILILFHRKKSKEYRSMNYLLTVGILFLSIMILLLNSVIGIISLLVIMAIQVWSLMRNYGIKKSGIAILLLLSLGFCFFYFNPLKLEKIESLRNMKDLTITDKQEERNLLTIRLAKWDSYLHIIKNNLLLGTTEADVKNIRKEVYLQKSYTDLYRYNYNAHNQYLESLASYGLAGFSIFLLMLFAPLKKYYTHPYFRFLILLFMLTFLTESVFNRQQGILGFMFFYALFSHRLSKHEQIRPSQAYIAEPAK